MPIGTELVNEIETLAAIPVTSDGFAQHYQIRHSADEASARVHAMGVISQGASLARSIDRFIDQRADNPYVGIVGKELIADVILRREQESAIYRSLVSSDNIRDADLRKSWHEEFAVNLVSDVRQADAHSALHNLRVISFNYDRCFAFYLVKDLSAYFSINIDLATNIVDSLDIIYPYGNLGRLPGFTNKPWDSNSSELGFGAYDRDTAIAAGQRLRTFTERIGEQQIVERIRETMLWADRVVYLGFAFERRNMELLQADKTSSRPAVWATAYGIDSALTQMNTSRIASSLGGVLSMDYVHFTCENLVKKYGPLWSQDA